MRYLPILCAALMLAAPASAQGSLTTLDEARVWYVAMMVANGCEMTAREIEFAMADAFPYATAAGQHDTGMAVEAAMSIYSDGLIEQSGFNQVRYTGPEC